MKLTILGSGTHYPSLKRNSASYLLQHKGKFYLFDIGAGAIKQLLRIGVDYRKIRHIFITHRHGDHISDLIPYIFTIKNQSLFGELKDKIFYFYGPKGFKKFLNDIVDKIVIPEKMPLILRVKELGKSQIKVGDLKIKSAPVKHLGGVPVIAYRINYKNKSLVYSGDLGYDKNIITLSKGADILILECGFPDQYPIEGHLTPAECGKIATQAKVKKLILTHFYPVCEKYNLKKQAQKYYKGPIILAKDLMEIKIWL